MAGIFKPSRRTAVGATPSTGYDIDTGISFSELSDSWDQEEQADFSAPIQMPGYRNPVNRLNAGSIVNSGWQSDKREMIRQQAREDEQWRMLMERNRVRQQNEQARRQKAQAEAEKKARNNQLERDFRSRGIEFYTDANGDIQPVLDEKTGRPVFKEKTSEVQYKPDTGQPFQIKRDRTGKEIEINPDKDAVIGENPNDPNDTFIYRQNKYQPWEAINPEEGLKSSDPRVRVASAKFLHSREIKELERQKHDVVSRLNHPDFPKALTDKERRELEMERTVLSQAFPQPEAKGGAWFGLGKKAVSQSELDAWRVLEEDRKKRLSEVEAKLQADDDRKALSRQVWEIEQRLFAAKQGGPGGFLKRWQEGGRKEAGLVSQMGEIEREVAEINRGIEANNARMNAINEELRRGVSGERAAELQKEAASIAASNRQLQEQGAAADWRARDLDEMIRARNERIAEEKRKDEVAKVNPAPEWADSAVESTVRRDDRGWYELDRRVSNRGKEKFLRRDIARLESGPDGKPKIEVVDPSKLGTVLAQAGADSGEIYIEPKASLADVPTLKRKTRNSLGSSQAEIGFAEEARAHNAAEVERVNRIKAERKSDEEIDAIRQDIAGVREKAEKELRAEVGKIFEATRSGALDSDQAEANIAAARERVAEKYQAQQRQVGEMLESARAAFWEGRISFRQARSLFEAAGISTEDVPDLNAVLKGKTPKETEKILKEYGERYGGQVAFNATDYAARVVAIESSVAEVLRNDRFWDWKKKKAGNKSDREAALEYLEQNPDGWQVTENFLREVRDGINSYIPAAARLGADLSVRFQRAFDGEVRKEWERIERGIREQGAREGLSEARIAARIKRARNEQYLDLINKHAWYEFAKAFDDLNAEAKDVRLKDSFSGKLGAGIGSALQFAAFIPLTGGVGSLAGRGVVGAGMARTGALTAGQQAGIAAARNIGGKIGTLGVGGVMSTDSIQEQVRALGGDPGLISYGLGGALGATELIGVSRSIEKIMGAGPESSRYLLRFLSPQSGRRIVGQIGEEAGQEVFQGMGERLTVQQFYDGLQDAWLKDNLGKSKEDFVREFGERPSVIAGGEMLEEGAVGGIVGALFEAVALGGSKARFARARSQARKRYDAARKEWEAAKENFSPEDFAVRLTVERRASDPNAPEVSPEQVTVTLDLIGDFSDTKQIDQVQNQIREQIALAEKEGDAQTVIALESMLADMEARKKELAERRLKEGLAAVEEIEAAREEADQLEAQAANDPANAPALQKRAKEIRNQANLGSAVAKIASGKPLSSLTTEELAAAGLVEAKGGGFKAAVGLSEIAKNPEAQASPVQFDGKGNPIITDRTVNFIGRAMPGVAGLVKMSESEARQHFEKTNLGNPADLKGEAEVVRTVAGDAERPASVQTQQEGQWTARGQNGTEVSIPASEAGTQAEAEHKLAAKLPAGELLDVDSIEQPRAVERRATVPNVSRGTQLREQMAPVIERADFTVRSRMQGVVDTVASQLDVYGAVFPGGFRIVSLPRGGGLAYNPELKVLEIDLNRVARQVAGAKNPAVLVQAMMREEVIHRAATDVLSPEEITRLWGMLPESLKGKVRDAYWQDRVQRGEPTPEDDPFTMGHEFIRMLTQDAFFRQVTESTEMDAGLVGYLRELLQKLVQQLRNILADPAMTDTATRQAVQEAEALVARRLSDLGVKKEVETETGGDAAFVPVEGNSGVNFDDGSDVSIREGLFAQLGDTGTAYTDNNDAVEYRWALAEIDDLVISNEDSGAINPRYPRELQPRDRNTAGSQAQVNDIARNSNFDRLSFSENVGNGAPIIGPTDGVAESGNGRLMGLRRAYDRGLPSIEVYREKLAANAGRFGLDGSKVAAMKKPVLVRVRQTPLNRRKFVEVANVSNVAPMRELEIARKDAGNLSPGLFDLFNPAEDGNIFTAGNQDFIRAFITNVVPQSERPAIIDSRGNLSQTGLRRIRNALFVYAYGDSPEAINALGRLAEDIEADGRNITNALIAAAPVFARQNAAIKNGALYDVGITDDLIAAVQALMDIRNRNENVSDYLAQGQLISDGITPFQREILQFLDDNKRSAKRIFWTLRQYAAALDAAGDPRQEQLFETDRPSKESLWHLATRPPTEAPVLSSGQRAMSAPNWMRVYNRLFNMERSGVRLNESQRALLNKAERELGQVLMFVAEGYGEGVAAGALDEGRDQGRLFSVERYPGKLGIEKQPGLDVEERALEARVAADFEANTEERIKQYLARYGNVINTDNVRELVPEYVANRSRWAKAVHNPASALANVIYERLLAGDETDVVFMAGGGGSGKGIVQPMVADADAIVFDGTLANMPGAVKKIEQALAAGKKVQIEYVHRPFLQAVKGILHRAETKGRTLDIGIAARDHYMAQRSFLNLVERYAKDSRVAFHVWDNSGRKEDLKEISTSDFKKKLYSSIDEIANAGRKWLAREIARRAAEGRPIPDAVQRGLGGVAQEDRSPSQENAGGLSSIRQGEGQSPRDGPPGSGSLPRELNAGSRSYFVEQLNLFDTLSEPQVWEVQSRTVDLFGVPFTESKPARNSKRKANSKRKVSHESGLRRSDELFSWNAAGRTDSLGEQASAVGEVPELDLFGGQELGAGYAGSTGRSDGGRDSGRPGGRNDLLPSETSPEDVGDVQGGSEKAGAGQLGGGIPGSLPSGKSVGMEGGRERRNLQSPNRQVRPEVGSPDRNHVIEDNDVLAPRGDVARIRANIAAIRLLRNLEAENRNPTVEEKKTLAQYVGWGGLSQAFDDAKAKAYANGQHISLRETADVYSKNNNSYYTSLVEDYRRQAQAIENWHTKWGKWHAELKELLTPEEYAAAAASTINAHYTSPEVIRAMWGMVEKLGFQGGSILEPAGGVGHFFGLMPERIADSSRLSAVELDSLTGRILSKLYPEADVQVTGFQDAKIPDNSVDLAISNVPFANVSIFDPEMDAAKAPKLSLHNYFFAKALQKVRPGGLIAFITTSNTMDANIQQRKWLAARAELIGAIRLPNTAFSENANTEVTTDILFLRKPDGNPPPFTAEAWVSTAEAKTRKGEPIQINEYFVRHPEMILGELDNDGKMYGGADEKGEMTVHPFQGKTLAESLSEAAERLPADVIFSPGEAANEKYQRGERILRETREKKIGTLAKLEDGTIVISGMSDQSEDILKPENRKLAEDFIVLRDTLNALYQAELNPDATDNQIETLRGLLNRYYDAFVRDHGNLHQFGDLLGVDPDYYRLLGAEIEQKPETRAESIRAILSRKKTYRKGDVFTKRVLTPRREPESAETVEDALGISLGWRGRLDTGFMARLLGWEQANVENELLARGMAFRNPESGLLETREEYLSGNVRKKLRIAEIKAAEDPAYAPNVEELRRVQPEDVKIADIRMMLGSAWIPADVVQRFAREIFGSEGVDVIYHPGRGEMIGDFWEVRYGGKGSTATSNLTVAMWQTYGTNRISGLQLLEKALNLQQPEIFDTSDDGKTRTFNPTATTQAKVAMQKIKDTFEQWVQRNPDVQEELAKTYNEVNNSHVLRQYDGQFLKFPWMAAGFDLFPEKKNVVWRAIQDGRMLIAHGVGGGKTIIGTAIAMELKRLGHARKPLIVVHNATLEQFAATINAMAPTARILVARKKDLEGPKRKEFMAKVAAGDWDAVVMAHSSFNKIPDDPAYEAKLINELKEELRDAITEFGGDPDGDARKTKDPSVKEMQKQLARLEERIKRLQNRERDNVLTFQELGIDALILDEAHLYKKIPFVSKLRRIAGIDNDASECGTGLMTKVRFIQEKNKGRNVFTMTGTPVTNTLGESWNMVRLVAPDLIKEFNVESFDRFVSTFADIVTSAELRANGSYKQIDRLAALSNLPEWNKFFRLAADVKMGEDMQVRGRPEIKGGKPELVAVERTPQVSKFTEFIKEVIEWYDKLDGKEKREYSYLPLLTYNAAKMAAIDIRLVDPKAKDEPGSKVNVALKKVLELYHRTSSYHGTQVIFADSFRPLKSTALNISNAELEAEEARAGDDASADREADTGDGFNLYRDIKSKLVASGIPESEVAIISDYNTDEKKERLFQQVNEGKVRIVIGSTQKLGTGVNMQQRMIAAHHLDVPWTPAELEQRDGRVYRQGNIHADLGIPVEIYRYGMKDTLDAALWQKLETKERFIKQAISGKINSRSIEDDAGLLNLAEQKAVLSGPLGMRKFQADQRVRELEAEERAWRMSLADAGQNARKAARWRALAEETLAEAERNLQVVAGWDSAPFNAEETQKQVNAMFEERLKLVRTISNPDTSPRATAPLGRFFYKGTEIELGKPKIIERFGEAKPENRWRLEVPVLVGGKSIGDASSAGWVLRRLEDYPGNLRDAADRARRDIVRYREQETAALAQLEQAFPKQAELEAALAEQAEVMRLASEKRSVAADTAINAMEAAPEKAWSESQTKPNETEQTFSNLGLYQNPGEFDFSDRGKTPGDLVKENMGLAVTIANDYKNIPGVEMADIIQQARVALVKAAFAFDANRGVPFGAYAGRVIRNELNTLYQRGAKAKRGEAVSLDEQIGENGESLHEIFPGQDGRDVSEIERQETQQIIGELVARLPERPRAIVRGFMAGRSGEEIAKEIGISRQMVHRILRGALAVIRQQLKSLGFQGHENGILFSGGRASSTPPDSILKASGQEARIDELRQAQQQGTLFAGERDEKSSLEDLFAELNRELPSQAEIDALRKKAAAEPIGQRTIGQPRKANYAKDDATRVEINVVQAMREDARKREEEREWIAEARQRIQSDRDGVKRTLLEKALDPARHGTLTAVDVKAAQLLVPELMREAYRSGDKTKQREAFALAWAYDAGGSDQARAFAARRDPFKTPAERHIEFLTKMVATPTAEQRKWINAAPTQEEKMRRLEQAQDERLAKIESNLKELGLTLEDIFAPDTQVGLLKVSLTRQALARLSAADRKVARYLIDGFSDKEITKALSIGRNQVEEISRRFDAALDSVIDAFLDQENMSDEAFAAVQKLMAGARVITAEQRANIKARLKRQIRPDPEKRNAKARPPRTKKPPLPKDATQEERDHHESQPWQYTGFDPTNKDQVVRVARLIQAADTNAIDMIYEAWINSILSGPQTHVVNIMGNGANALWDFMVQRPMEAAVNAIVRDQNSASFGELRHLFRGVIPGIVRGWQAAVRAWDAENDFFESEKLNQQMELEDFDKAGGIKLTIPGKIGRVIRIPGRALMFMDSFFKYATGQMEAGAQAYRLGKALGLEGQAMEDFIRTEINLPGSMSWQRAVEKAKELTFQTPLPKDGIGGIARKIGEMRRGKSTSIGGRLLELFLGMTFPFIRTPYNIFRIGLRKSPLGVLNVAYHISEGFYAMRKGRPFVEGYSKAQFVTDLAEQALAWAGMALLWGMIEGDGDDDDDKLILITGSRPYGVDRQGERDALNRMFGGTYQIRVGGRNGVYLDYGRIEPFATVLGTVADMVRLAKSQDTSDAGVKLFGYFMAQASQKTFLQGFSTIADTIDGAMRDPKSVGKAWERQFLAGLVPNIIRQPLRNLDDFVRDSKYAGVDYTLFAAPNMAEKRVNLYGEDMRKQGNGLSRLFFAAGIKPTETMKVGDLFLVNWNKKNRDQAYWPERPNSAYYRLKNRDGDLVEMTPGQIATLDRMAGQAFERKLQAWLTPARAINPTEADLKRFKDDLSDARREAKEAITRRALLVSP